MDPASTPAPNSNPPAAAPHPNAAAEGGIPPIWEGLIAYLVFLRWKQANNLWRVLRGSVFVLLFLAFASLTELLLHFTGAFPEVEHFLTVQLHHGVQGVVIIVLLTLSIIVVSVHHFKEVKKPEYEFTFIKSVFDFTVGQHAFRPGACMKLAEALAKFGPMFQHAKLDCLALFYEHQEGQLSVKEHHVYPNRPWWKEPIFCKAGGATGCAILRRAW